jgi:site-specific recombinase XerC
MTSLGGLKMAKRKTAKKRGGLAPDKYLSEAQLKKLRQYVRDKADLARMRAGSRGVIDELIVELLVSTGLRASELCNLNIGDLPAKHGKDCIWVRDGKGKVTRTVDISEKLKKRLERFVKLYRKRARANSALLISERGDRIIYRSIYAKIKRIGEQAGVGKLHPHMLRHTYLTRLYNIEKDLRFVQDQAGHASPTTTAIYAKTNNTARRRQVQALDEEEF